MAGAVDVVSTNSNMSDLEKVPICALRYSTKSKLCGMLNSVKVIPTDEGLLR